MIITKTFDFDAGHHLPNVEDGHKCKRSHGHTYRVEVAVEGHPDPKLGWIVDFVKLDWAWGRIHGEIDHRVLNDVPGLENPTCEILALWILKRFVAETHGDIGVLKGCKIAYVKVFESSTTSCSVTEEDLGAWARVSSMHKTK